jgi:GT2 family glycosyltransferase
LEQAKGEFILLINDDVVIFKGAINILIDFLKNNQKVGLVGPKILYPDGNNQPSCFRFYSPMAVVCRRTILGKLKICKGILSRFLYQDKNLNQGNGVEVDWILNGAGVMTKKEYLDRVGMLDERFKHYFSDVDWCRRFWQSDFKVVYLPKVSFVHYHGKRSQGRGIISVLTNKMTRTHVWDGMKYFWKWGMRDAKMRMRANDTNIFV